MALCVIPAVGVAFLLVWTMQAMVGMEGRLEEPHKFQIVDFVRVKRETQVEPKKRELPKKAQQEEPPVPEIDLGAAPRPSAVEGEGLAVMDSSLELDEAPDITATRGADTDIIPLVRVEPLYPPKAAQQGISGWVELRFTITSAGTVRDPRVTAFYPSRVFNRAALRAVRKWKYAPKVEDGKAVERTGVGVRLSFRIADAQG